MLSIKPSTKPEKASISLFFHGTEPAHGACRRLKDSLKKLPSSKASQRFLLRMGHLSAGMVTGASSASALYAASRDPDFPWQIFLSHVKIRLNCYLNLKCNGFLFWLPQPTSEADIIAQHSL